MKDKEVELMQSLLSDRQTINNLEEQYVHFANCIEGLNTAWSILKKIKMEDENPPASFAFQFALIEYSKPYKDSNSAYKNTKGKPLYKHRLGTSFIPQSLLPLHERIINSRDKILAHLDLDIRDAKIYVQSSETGRNIIRSQNITNGANEMENIDHIIELIEKKRSTQFI